MTEHAIPEVEIKLAQELCCDMGECSATYYIILLLNERARLEAQVKTLREALLDRIATENGNDVPTLGDVGEMASYLKKYAALAATEPKP